MIRIIIYFFKDYIFQINSKIAIDPLLSKNKIILFCVGIYSISLTLSYIGIYYVLRFLICYLKQNYVMTNSSRSNPKPPTNISIFSSSKSFQV